jgi:hypothetical protein
MPMLGPNGFLDYYSRPQQLVAQRLVLCHNPVTVLTPCRTPECMQLAVTTISGCAGLQQTFSACSAGSTSTLLPLLPVIHCVLVVLLQACCWEQRQPKDGLWSSFAAWFAGRIQKG